MRVVFRCEQRKHLCIHDNVGTLASDKEWINNLFMLDYVLFIKPLPLTKVSNDLMMAKNMWPKCHKQRRFL